MIKKEEVLKAQEKWGQGLVEIGKVKNDRQSTMNAAVRMIDQLYAFHLGKVLFKPTKASVVQFRPDRESALSYFIGGNPAYAEDHGFALHPWTKVRFENSGIILEEKRALAMGNYFFTAAEGSVVKVEYTFGYIKDEKGNLLIDVHHSSLPYMPDH